MTYEKFLEEFLSKGLLRRQESDLRAVQRLILRAYKDLKTAKANLEIDEGIAYTVAYLAMLHAARAFILLKGFRPADGYQHKTVVEFISHFLGKEFRVITEQFDRMRRKRNIFTYEIDISISKSEATDALNSAARFVDLIKGIVQKENPQMEFNF
jgi:uncharacterized protein (UPF0332 family)